MDFDSFITFILVLLFFVGPTILKQWQKKQKKSSSDPNRETGEKRGTGVFGKIGDQVRQFIKDLEQQALETKRKAEQGQDQQTVWDGLREDDAQDIDFSETPYADRLDEIELPNYEETEIEKEPIPEPLRAEPTPVLDEEIDDRNVSSQGGQIKLNQLQNAVAWSEILSKPIALRED